MTDPLDGFALRPLAREHPWVQERIDAFYNKVKLAKPNHHPALRWFGFFKGEKPSLVVALVFRPDDSIEVTDFYPAPTRDGVRAGYAGMNLLKVLVDSGICPYWLGGIVAVNDFGRRHAEKFFGMSPRSIVYKYDGVKA